MLAPFENLTSEVCQALVRKLDIEFPDGGVLRRLGFVTSSPPAVPNLWRAGRSAEDAAHVGDTQTDEKHANCQLPTHTSDGF